MHKSLYEHIWIDILQRNIDDLYYFDDNLLNEGLIKSWSNENFIKFLKKQLILFNLDFFIEIDTETIILRINNFNILQKRQKRKLYEELNKLLNLTGYYVSTKYDLVKFINLETDILILEFNMKFNSESGIPPILYHVSYNKYLHKIEENGLIPKSKKLLDDHPERIYFSDNIKDAIKFAKSKYLLLKNDEYSEFIIVEINTKKLNKIKLYNDPLKIPNTNMYYTHDNIPPYSIIDIKEYSLNEYKRYLKIKKINEMKILKFNDFLNEKKNFKYEYGCLMLDFKVSNWKKDILSIIDEDDIYDEEEGYGYEDKPHVTVLYGLIPDKIDIKEFKEKINDSGIDINKEYELKKISIFENSDDYDVVKFDLEDCEELHELNEFVRDNFKYENDYPDYEPHVTLAYVKKGKGKKYVQKLEEAIIVEPKKLVYSDPDEDGEKTVRRTITEFE